MISSKLGLGRITRKLIALHHDLGHERAGIVFAGHNSPVSPGAAKGDEGRQLSAAPKRAPWQTYRPLSQTGPTHVIGFVFGARQPAR